MNLAEFIAVIEVGNPELAAQLRQIAEDMKKDITELKVTETFRLEKFDGEYTPDKQPFEVIEGASDRETVVIN